MLFMSKAQTSKPTKAQLFNGLRRRTTYEEISQEINPDKTKVVYPNRDAKQLREDPRVTQLDGVGFFESMQDQEEATIKEQRRDTTIRQIAMDNNTGLANARATEPARQRPTEFYDIGHDDAHMQSDEEQVAQGLEQANIHSKLRKKKPKRRQEHVSSKSRLRKQRLCILGHLRWVQILNQLKQHL